MEFIIAISLTLLTTIISIFIEIRGKGDNSFRESLIGFIFISIVISIPVIVVGVIYFSLVYGANIVLNFDINGSIYDLFGMCILIPILIFSLDFLNRPVELMVLILTKGKSNKVLSVLFTFVVYSLVIAFTLMMFPNGGFKSDYAPFVLAIVLMGFDVYGNYILKRLENKKEEKKKSQD